LKKKVEIEVQHFTGCPNSADLIRIKAPIMANLACRYYQEGLPTINCINKIIKEQK
jgi:hypothetical protein